jgi:hypothetical protein
MTSIDEYSVEIYRDGLLLSSSGRFATLFDATRAALELVEQLGRAPPGTALHVEVRRGTETFLDIEIVPGRPLDR